MKKPEGVIWCDKKRPFLGLPWSFTRYYLYDDKLVIDTGLLSRKEEEIRLYRIMDVSLKRGLGQRIVKIGTIHCCSGDKTAPEFELKHIKNSREVKNKLSDMIESERLKRHVGMREYLDGDDCEVMNDR
ncbi:MAG: PH domain-containing protein [Clostridia bacterium]|nr:PH domain-containing protein [Clostridia bacterium]